MRTALSTAVLLCFSIGLSAQTAPAPDTAAAAVKKAERAFMTARNAHDVEAVDALLADGWVMLTHHGTLVTKAQFLEELKKGVSTYEMPVMHDEKITIHGHTATIATHHSFKHKMADGRVVENTNRALFVYTNDNGTWKMVSLQGTNSKPPAK